MTTATEHVLAYDAAWRITAIKHIMAEQSAISFVGSLRRFWQQWRKIGAPKKVVRWLRKGYALPFKREAGQGARIPLSKTCPAGLITKNKRIS